MRSELNKYLELEEIPSVIEVFLKNGHEKRCPKGNFFVEQGCRSNGVGYVAEGGFRHLRIKDDNNEQIVGYSFKDDFVTDFPSFGLHQPSAVSVEAIRDSVLYVLWRDEIELLFSSKLHGKLIEVSLSDIYDRLLSMYCDTPEVRYRNLLHRYPDILRQVDLKEIASLLKITPETLSRIRKKILLDTKNSL
jgi:CRP-like cAMP-binding protein